MSLHPLAQAAAEWRVLWPLVEELWPRLERFGEALLECWSAGGKLMTCGNGGSAADAVHFAEELVARFERDRKALPAVALLDAAVVTCAANDFGYDRVFARQVEALGRPGDVLAVFTTSGNSPNVLRAVEAAHARGLVTCAFLGRDGGRLKGRCHHELHIPAPSAHRTQEAHVVLYHALCQWLDARVAT